MFETEIYNAETVIEAIDYDHHPPHHHHLHHHRHHPFSPRKPSGHLMMILSPILANIISFPQFAGMSGLTGLLNLGCCLPISSCMLSSASRHCSQGRLFKFVPGVYARP